MPEVVALIKISPLQSLGVFLLIAAASYAWGTLFCRRSGIYVKIAAGMVFLALLQRLILPFTAERAPFVAPTIIALSGLTGLFLLWKRENHEKLCFWAVVFIIFSAPAYLPPHGWDEQVYQTPFLIEIARSGAPGSIAANPYAAYGLLDHYLLAGAANYGGTALLRLLSLFGVIYLTALVWSKLKSRSKFTAALCAGLFFTGNLSIQFSHIFFAESFVAMLFGAGYVALSEAKSPFWRKALLAGVFSGSAIAVKLTGFAPALTLFVLLWREKRSNYREYLRDTALFALASGVVVFAFYLRNYLECGDFFYPFVNGVSDSDSATVDICKRMTALGSERYGAGPLYGTIFGWFFAGFYRRIYDGFILGWAWIFFLLTIIFSFMAKWARSRRLSRHEALLLGGFLAGYLFWALTSQQSRFLYYLCAPAAIGAGVFLAPSGKVTAVLRTIGALFLAFFALLTIKYLYVAVRYLPEARKDPAHFALTVAEDKAYMASVGALNKISAGDPRPVARLYESRNLYLAAPSVDITPGFNRLLTPLPENAQDLYEKLRNYSAILYVPAYRQMDHALDDRKVRIALEALLLECLRDQRLTIRTVPGSDDLIFLPAEPELSGGADNEESNASN